MPHNIKEKDHPMKNIRLVIEYDGTDYCGWQIQPNGITVQQCINDALSRLEGKAINVTGAGRTDSGVHALGQTANFITQSNIPPEKYRDALNSLLPDSIRVNYSEEVPFSFNARFSAKKKTYKYTVRNSHSASAIGCRYEYHFPGSLDIESMRRACEYYTGEHDFAAFMASGSSVKDTVRTVFDAHIDVDMPLIVFNVTGNGFLYKMVRFMTGTLLDIGRGKYKPEYVKLLLEKKGDVKAATAAPAKGLLLYGIEYE